MATSGGRGGGGAGTPATRRPASKWRELMGRRARHRDNIHYLSSNRCSSSEESQTHGDDLMSLEWKENMRQQCDRLFAAGGGEPARENEKAKRSQESHQISSNFQMMQCNGSQNQARPSWSVQKQVNNNCVKLAQWLAELAKIPPPLVSTQGEQQQQQQQQEQQQQQQRTQAANYQTRRACPDYRDDQNQDNMPIQAGDPSWHHQRQNVDKVRRMNEIQQPMQTTEGTNNACVCCTWASLHPYERAKQLYEERTDGDNLSALSASSSLLSQLLNSSLNQLIEIDNGSSTCCLCDSNQPCAIGGPALAATMDDCNQHKDLTDGRRAQLAAESQGRRTSPDIHLLPPPPTTTQQVVDERDLLVVEPMNGGARRHLATPAAHEAQLRRAKSSDHLTTTSARHQQVRHGDREQPTKSRAQLDGAEHEKTSQLMRAQEDGDEQNGATARRSALNCDQCSFNSSSGSCSTQTATVASDFERLRQQILEVHKCRGASRKRDPLARRRQIRNSQHSLRRISGKQQEEADSRRQQFVTFDKDATISQGRGRLQCEVSPERNFLNNQGGRQGNSTGASADLLECCRGICARISGTTLTQDVVASKVKSVADYAQEQERATPDDGRQVDISRVKQKRLATNGERVPLEGELINCSLIMGNGQQQHDSLLEVCKSSRPQSGQPLEHSGSSSCMESSLSCFTSLAHVHQERSHPAAPQECYRLPAEDYAQGKHAAPAAGATTTTTKTTTTSATNKCLGKEGAPASLLKRRPFINHLNQRRPREREHEEVSQVLSSCDEHSRTTSNEQSGGSISGSAGEHSRGSSASSTSISSSEVSLGDLGSSSSCAIRVTTTSGDSSEDCSCGVGLSRVTSRLKQVQHQATSGQQANKEAIGIGGQNKIVASPLERATGNDDPGTVSSQSALIAECSDPNRKQVMGLIGSRQQQQQHKQLSLGIEVKGGSRRELKQYDKRQQAAHDLSRIDLICNSENDLPASEGNLVLSYDFDASELCAWESKFAHHPSSSSSSSSSSSAQLEAGNASERAILSHQISYPSELLHKKQQQQLAITDHYITKQHQLTSSAQLYARNFVALPLYHQHVERPEKQHAGENEDGVQSGRRLLAAGVIFSLDPSQEAADRASMVEATAQMVRVISSRDSSRPTSRASSGAGMEPITFIGRTNNPPRPHNVIDATTLEPIYDVPSLSQIDIVQPPPTGQRCLSPDQKYPKVGVAGHLASSSQTQLDRPERQTLRMAGNQDNVHLERVSQRRETLVKKQAAIIEQKHNQRRDDEGGGERKNSHAESLHDGRCEILFHQFRESGNANSTSTPSEATSKPNLGHSRTRLKKLQREKDDCDYKYERERGLEMDDDNKHKSSEGGHEGTRRGGRQVTVKAGKKKVTCTQPSETITTANATNLNARQEQQAQEPATIRHTRRRRQHQGQSRRYKSQINNLLSPRADEATTSSLTSSCSCSGGLNGVSGCPTTLCSSCSFSLSDKCSCCPSSLISPIYSPSILHLLSKQTRALACSCEEDSQSPGDQSPGSLTQAYLRRHQYHCHHNPNTRRYAQRSRPTRQVLVASGLRSPVRRNGRRRRNTSGPKSISSGRLLRLKLRHMQLRRAHAHRAHSSRTTDGRRSSHGGHAGCSHSSSGGGGGGVSGQLPPRHANAMSYKVFEKEERVRPRSLIRDEHPTGALSKVTTTIKSGGIQRHPVEPLEALSEGDEELTAEGGASGSGHQRQPQESELADGEQSQTNLKTFNEQQQRQLPDDRGSLIIGQHTRTRRPDQKPLSELDKRENKRKSPERRLVNLMLSKNRAPGGASGGREKINATSASPRADISGSLNDDLNQHADGRARSRTRATSSHRLCRPTSELSCGCSSCSQLTVALSHHCPRRHHGKSHHNTAIVLDETTRQELDRIRLLRQRQQKLIRRLLEVGEQQEISPSRAADAAASAASKQLKIEYLSRGVGAVARELKSRRHSYKSRVRHIYQQQQRRHLKRAPSGSSWRFNNLLAAPASSSHDIIRADQLQQRRRSRSCWTNEGYPAVSGLLRWRRSARHRPISGVRRRPHAASSLSYSAASCCRRRRCSLTSSSCVSGSLVTSLSRGAHLRTGGHHRHWRRWPRRNCKHLGRNQRNCAQRHNGARPRRATTETNDDSALRAAATRASLSARDMTRAEVAAPGQAATVGQLHNMQQALIAFRRTTTSGDRHITWKRRRHELNPKLTLVAARQYDCRQPGRRRRRRRRTSSSSWHSRRAHKGDRSERGNNLTKNAGDSKFNMNKFLIKRVDPSAKMMRVIPATSKMEISRPHPPVPFTWQLTNHCQCKHCCLVGRLVRMDLEGAATRRRKSSNFNGAADNN